jgi:uncharacterized protein
LKKKSPRKRSSSADSSHSLAETEARLVGLISDTHGLLRPEAEKALAGCDLILHAGDVGDPAILDRLRSIAPVIAVRGNIDVAPWAAGLPLSATVPVGEHRIHMLHSLQDLKLDPQAAGFAFVISGHSHQPGETERSGVRYINPGSAGPRRFRLPVTVARLHIQERPPRLKFIELL